MVKRIGAFFMFYMKCFSLMLTFGRSKHFLLNDTYIGEITIFIIKIIITICHTCHA